MKELCTAGWRLALTSTILFGAMSASTSAADLSRYRHFQLGTDISTVAKQAGTSVSDAKTIHRRPAVIQEIQWRPGGSGAVTHTESSKDVVLSFLDGQLFQITVKYDHYDTAGMTNEDMVEAISTSYGSATAPPRRMASSQGSYGDEELVIAQWQDMQYRFDLIRSSYGPSFRLVGVLKRMEVPARQPLARPSGSMSKKLPSVKRPGSQVTPKRRK